MLRLLPALCGSLLPCCVYKLLLETKLHKFTATFGGLLIVFDNSLLAQSRFVLMEPLMLLFSTLGILFLLKSCARKMISFERWMYAILAAACLTCGLSVKYVGVYTLFLGFMIMARHCWTYLSDKTISSELELWLLVLTNIKAFSSRHRVHDRDNPEGRHFHGNSSRPIHGHILCSFDRSEQGRAT
jgi:dolichyl-phosphate-mannose-protein mannosyltransferase